MSEPVWLTIARKYLNVHEVVGSKHNPQILRWWSLIRAPFTDDETPWCAGFVGGVLEEAGLRSTRAASARSYMSWTNGVKLSKPVVGAIVVFERGPVNGHVGFVVGRRADGMLMVLGGNQGNAVNIKAFPLSRVLGFYWPKAVPLVAGALPVLNSSGQVSSNEA